MSRKLITVGGAGQMVLHYYLQQYLLGQCEETFDAYVLDTDSGANSLQALASFFDDTRRALTVSEKRKVPSIRIIQISPPGDQGNVDELLMQEALPAQPGFHHPCQGFFDRDCLSMSVKRGMYARPSLSAVVSFAEAIQVLGAETFEPDSRIVVAGSCIGGTGGGLLIPLIWRLVNLDTKDFKVTPVFLGDFFTPAANTARVSAAEDGSDIELFRSNRLAFLACLQEAVPNLWQFAFIQERRMESRDWGREREARQLPWPAADEPYWKAAAACEHLFGHTVSAPSQRFAQREVAEESFIGKINRGVSENRLANRLSRVETFLARSVLAKIGAEAPVRTVWGDGIVDYLSSAWRLLLRDRNFPIAPAAFLQALNRQLAEIWRGAGVSAYGVLHVFPGVARSDVPIAQFAKSEWPRPLTATPAGGASQEDAVRSVAAALLYAVVTSQR